MKVRCHFFIDGRKGNLYTVDMDNKIDYWLSMARHVCDVYGVEYTGTGYNYEDVLGDAKEDLTVEQYMIFRRMAREEFES